MACTVVVAGASPVRYGTNRSAGLPPESSNFYRKPRISPVVCIGALSLLVAPPSTPASAQALQTPWSPTRISTVRSRTAWLIRGSTKGGGGAFAHGLGLSSVHDEERALTALPYPQHPSILEKLRLRRIFRQIKMLRHGGAGVNGVQARKPRMEFLNFGLAHELIVRCRAQKNTHLKLLWHEDLAVFLQFLLAVTSPPERA